LARLASKKKVRKRESKEKVGEGTCFFPPQLYNIQKIVKKVWGKRVELARKWHSREMKT